MDSEMRNSLFTLLREVNDAGVMKDSQLRDCIDELEEQILTTRPEPAADAVIFTCTNPECDACEAERDPFPDMTADMVHALHEALVNSAPKWIIDREDGELLDMARAALAAVEPEIDVDGVAVAVQAGLNEYTRSRIVKQDGESYIKGYEPAGELEAIRKAIATALQAAVVEPWLSLDAVEAMLDDPNVVSALGRSFAQRRNGEADYESRPSYRSFCDGEGVSEVEAALAVMREVQAAVRQTKENGDG